MAYSTVLAVYDVAYSSILAVYLKALLSSMWPTRVFSPTDYYSSYSTILAYSTRAPRISYDSLCLRQTIFTTEHYYSLVLANGIAPSVGLKLPVNVDILDSIRTQAASTRHLQALAGARQNTLTLPVYEASTC